MTNKQTAGLTVIEVARRYRVGSDKVRGWIRRGELAAINTADRRCGKPRFVVTVEALADFERARNAAAPASQKRRRGRLPTVKDYLSEN